MKPDDENSGASRDSNPDDLSSARDFGLLPPSDRDSRADELDARARSAAVPSPPPPADDPSSKSLSWKGFEEEEEYHPEIDFDRIGSDGEDEMDMTPMVDVTFLLLIFFMVTASFVTQRSIQQPKPSDEQPSTNVVEMEDQNDYVEVIIDQNNTYRVTSRDEEEIEAPSDPEMRGQMRNAKERLNARKLVVTAHEECWHEKVVRAWDYGTTLGFEEIEIKTTTQDY